MQKFRFKKEQKAVYTETQEFEVVAEDYEKAKLIAVEMAGKPLEDSENIIAGKWELSHNSFKSYPVELNSGNPTVCIYNEDEELLIDNAPSTELPLLSEFDLNAWWENLPDELKDVFSSAVTDCYDNPEKMMEDSGKDLYRIFWEKLEAGHRGLIYRYWRIKSSHIPLAFDRDRELTIKLASGLADYCLMLEFGMGLNEMADPNGGYLEPYIDSFNRYYDDIEDSLMNYRY